MNKQQRTQALKNFILTLSDQQLVTGIALLVALFANWCTMSLYELNMVVALAWFSSATHLATLVVLRDYFQQNGVVRNWRIFGMVLIMLPLVVGLLMTGIYALFNLALPLQCLGPLYAGVTEYDCNGSVLVVTKALSNNVTVYNNGSINLDGSYYNNCTNVFGVYQGGISPITIVGSIWTAAYLIVGYVGAVLSTFTTSENDALTSSYVALLALQRVARWTKHGRSETIEVAISNERSKTKSIGRSKGKLYRTATAYSASFLSQIGTSFFALSYGITQITTLRWGAYHPQLQAGSTRIDFGQIVPLILLILPLLSAAEIFNEKEIKEHVATPTEDTVSTQTGTSGAEFHDAHANNSVPPCGNEQVHAPTGNRAALESEPPDASASRSPADPHRPSAAPTSRVSVKIIFFFHISLMIEAGVGLNMLSGLEWLGLFGLIFVFGGKVARFVGRLAAARKAVLQARTNKNKNNKTSGQVQANSSSAPDNNIELRGLPSSDAASQAATDPDQPSSTEGTAPSSTTSAEPLNAVPPTSQQASEGGNQAENLASLPAPASVQGPAADASDDSLDWVPANPHRHDTESGLRERISSAHDD
ncbi:hypothetical protein AYL99_08392 [Fonsecaea erecta]|uniref:Uncharacterized protein n=1 Tax=Fonsecaea erecta TaxID=1367422 RepID=A0A178ZCX8_9EURO|nr:hypothetical protein AYL99_08392 [Fonsecaea erecta]OAP57654.1 hypothetical protein AYL99_08392 [Fonsecaea erecta]